MQYSVYGCKVNKFYIAKWLQDFKARGIDINNKVLIATCVVTDRAKAKWLKETKKHLQDQKDVFLTWCGAFDKGDSMDYDKFFALYPELSTFRQNLFLLPEDPQEQKDMPSLSDYELNADVDFNPKTRLFTKKFIVIQSGCDTHCTFCLTILKRGSNRNREAVEILNEIQEFADHGWKEIVITGVNLAAWGATNTRKPQESQFAELLEMMLKRTSIPRIRISSLGPEFLTDRFFDVLSDQRFLPHFHFSIQSFSDNVLKSMNRNYKAAKLDEVLTKIRQINRPDRELISLWADIIVWFPWETEEDFMQTYNGIRDYNITKLHAFPFSSHNKWESVPASTFKNQIPKEIKKEREQKVLTLGDDLRKNLEQKSKGQKMNILLEDCQDGVWSWWTPNYLQWSIVWDYNRGDIVEIIY